MKVKSLSHVRLCATPWAAAYGSSVHGIFQARVLEWGAIAFSGFGYTDTHLIFGNAITKVRDSMAALGVYFWMELPPHSQLGVGGDLQ